MGGVILPYLLNSEIIREENINIRGIPCIRLTPRIRGDKLLPTIVFYHGWGSSKESQRFRGFILSNLGYQVIIPGAIYHGERRAIDHKDIGKTGKYFWETVLNNMDEFHILLEELIGKYNTNPDNIAVMGHSMGGISAAGIFTHNDNVKTSVVLNGSFNWTMLNEILLEQFSIDKPIGIGEEALVKKLDPMNNLAKLVDRPLLILHGGEDSMVSKVPQEIFYEKIKPLYKNENNICMIEYPYLNHFVTTNMLEEATKWILEELKGGL